MRASLLALAAGLSLMAVPAAAQVAPAPVTLSGPPLLSISITESIEAAPDIATISTGVEAKGATASEAMAKQAAAMAKLIAAIKGAGIEARDIQTSAINLHAQYVYGQKGPNGSDLPPRFTGYQASNMLTVRSRDIARLGPLLDRFVAAGATNINGPTFSIDKPAPLADQARLKAMATGKARAELYAKAAGYNRVRLVSVSEGAPDYPRPPMPMLQMATREAKADTQIEAGEISTGVTVNLTFAMEN